jgi:hypothetical protein
MMKLDFGWKLDYLLEKRIIVCELSLSFIESNANTWLVNIPLARTKFLISNYNQIFQYLNCSNYGYSRVLVNTATALTALTSLTATLMVPNGDTDGP